MIPESVNKYIYLHKQQEPKPAAQEPYALPPFWVHSVVVKHVPFSPLTVVHAWLLNCTNVKSDKTVIKNFFEINSFFENFLLLTSALPTAYKIVCLKLLNHFFPTFKCWTSTIIWLSINRRHHTQYH